MNQSSLPPIYIISLKHSLDRRQFMEQQMEHYQLPFTFFDAIDGRKLTQHQLNCYDDQRRQQTPWFPHQLQANEIGCALSHLNIFALIVKQQQQQTVILEDDTLITEDFVEIYRRQIKMPLKQELLYYYHGKAKSLHRFSSIYNHYKIKRFLKQSQHSIRSIIGTSAYQVSLMGAKKLLATAYPIIMPIDVYMGHMNIHGVRTYGVEPNCCWPDTDNFVSTIGERPD